MRSARYLRRRSCARAFRIMPRYVEGTAPTSPLRGAWGAIGAARRLRGTSPRAEQSARFGCKPRDGGRGGPGARLAKRALCGARAPTLNSTCVWRAVAGRDDREAGRRACGAPARPPNEVGQGRPSQPGAALAVFQASAVTGGTKARSTARHVGTARQAGSSPSALSSSSTSAAKASSSTSRCVSVSASVGASTPSVFVRVSFAGCVASWICFNFSIETCV